MGEEATQERKRLKSSFMPLHRAMEIKKGKENNDPDTTGLSHYKNKNHSHDSRASNAFGTSQPSQLFCNGHNDRLRLMFD